MATFCVFTRPEAPQFARLVLWLLDLPSRGVHVGGGIHVNNDAAPPNPCPLRWPGWTTRHVYVIAKPTNTGLSTDQFAFRVTPELQTAWIAKRSQLTLAQRNFVQSHLDSAADLALDPAWLSLVQGQQVLRETEDVEPEP